MYIPRASERQKEKEHIKNIFCCKCRKKEAFVEVRGFDFLSPEQKVIFERGILAYYFVEHGVDFLKLLLYLPDIHNKIDFIEIVTFINCGTDLTTLQENYLLLKKIMISIKKRNYYLYRKIVKYVSSRAIFIKNV
jgi:hypothetical protein